MMVLKVGFSFLFSFLLLLQQLGNIGLCDWFTDGLSLLEGVAGLWKGGGRGSRQQRRCIDLPMVCLFWREWLVSGREEASRDVGLTYRWSVSSGRNGWSLEGRRPVGTWD
jgi:hypothetical protein